MRRAKSAVAVGLAAAILLGTLPAAAAPAVRVVVDGVPLATDVPAQVIRGATMVPLRAVAHALGAQVQWQQGGTVRLVRGRQSAELAVGRREARVNGALRTLDSPPVLVGGRVLVPLRFVGEALGAEVAWDPATRTASVRTGSAGGTGARAELPADEVQDPAAAVTALGPVAPELVARVTERLPALWDGVWAALGPGEAAGAPRAGLPRVVLVADRQRFLEQLLRDGAERDDAERMARYAAGYALGNRVYVLAEGAPDDVLAVLAHELGHVALNRRGLAGRIPQWLNEGLVEYVARSLVEGDRASPLGSRYWGEARRRVLDRAAAGTLEDLFARNQEFIDRLGDYPAHAQAMWAVTLLVERAGWQAVDAYLDAVARVGHEPAFQAAFQTTTELFTFQFRRFLRRQLDYEPRAVIRLELLAPIDGWLAIFLPGSQSSDSWRLTGRGILTLTVAPDRRLTVAGPAARDEGRYWTLQSAAQPYLTVYLVPEVPLRTEAGTVQQVALAFGDAYGYWYWAGAGAHVDRQFRDSGGEPGWPGLLRVLEVRTEGVR